MGSGNGTLPSSQLGDYHFTKAIEAAKTESFFEETSPIVQLWYGHEINGTSHSSGVYSQTSWGH